MNENIEYLSQYIHVDDDLMNKLNKHISRYNLSGEICAYYSDWEDFCSDWCSEQIGYTRTEAKKLLHNNTGEFMILPCEKGIVRFSI